MGDLFAMLSTVPPWVVLLAVFALPALEASTLLGVVVPGETAVLLGGVLAHQNQLPLAAVMSVAALGAVAGDTVGYALGARVWPVLFSRSGRTRRQLDAGRDFVRRFGGPAVFLARWVAVLRAVVPSVAGATALPYRTFARYNIAGGTLWAAVVAGAGFLAGAAYQRVERDLGLAGAVAALVVAAAVVIGVGYLRWQRRGAAADAPRRFIRPSSSPHRPRPHAGGDHHTPGPEGTR
jgi:membrane-associated protein